MSSLGDPEFIQKCLDDQDRRWPEFGHFHTPCAGTFRQNAMPVQLFAQTYLEKGLTNGIFNGYTSPEEEYNYLVLTLVWSSFNTDGDNLSGTKTWTWDLMEGGVTESGADYLEVSGLTNSYEETPEGVSNVIHETWEGPQEPGYKYATHHREYTVSERVTPEQLLDAIEGTDWDLPELAETSGLMVIDEPDPDAALPLTRRYADNWVAWSTRAKVRIGVGPMKEAAAGAITARWKFYELDDEYAIVASLGPEQRALLYPHPDLPGYWISEEIDVPQPDLSFGGTYGEYDGNPHVGMGMVWLDIPGYHPEW